MTAAVPVTEAIFAFTSGFTLNEYLATLSAEDRTFLAQRYRSVRLDVDSQAYLTTYSTWIYMVLLVSAEMPDTAMVLPIVQRLAESSPRLDVRIVPEESSLLALNELLDDDLDLETNLSDLELPLLFFFDEEWNQQEQWGPRPQQAEERLEEWLRANPAYEALFSDDGEEDTETEDMLREMTHEMRLWYNQDLTQACVREIVALLRKMENA